MPVTFTMTYNVFDEQLTVLIDGQKAGPYSQFARCGTTPFSEWCTKLPDYCTIEANDRYKVIFTGPAFHFTVLKAVFSGIPDCITINGISEIIKPYHRLGWLHDLAYTSLPPFTCGTNFSISELSKFSSLVRTGSRFHLKGGEKSTFCIETSARSANGAIISASTESEAKSLANQFTKNRLIVVPDTKTKVLSVQNDCYIMGCTKSDLESLCVSYIGDVLLTEYIQKVNSLPACPSNRRMSTDEARIKRTLLTEVQPYLKLKVPAKAELSSSAGWSLIKYPEDIPCSLISKNPNTVQVQSGGKLILAGEGKAVLHA